MIVNFRINREAIGVWSFELQNQNTYFLNDGFSETMNTKNAFNARILFPFTLNLLKRIKRQVHFFMHKT